MSQYLDNLKDIADAIREAEGSEDPIIANEFTQRIFQTLPDHNHVLKVITPEDRNSRIEGGRVRDFEIDDNSELYRYCFWNRW